MAIETMRAVEIETAADANAAVLWLHGLGDSGHGWSDIVGSLGLAPGLAVRFVFPHAPAMPVTINDGTVMPAWYDIREANFNEHVDLAGVQRSQRAVEALVAREQRRGIAARRIMLAGFSQGGAIALYAGVRHSERLAGIVALSAYLIDAGNLGAEAASSNRDVPIFMAHGTQDTVVPLAWGDRSRADLVEGGWKVEWHTYPMAHAAVMEEIAAVGKFITAVLQ